MPLGWLLSWWRGRGEPAPVRVDFFTRNGCHLCEDAWELVQTEQQREGFTLLSHDVDTDATWKADYGECVPVVLVNGKVRFRGRVNPVLLRRLLRAERKGGRGA